MEYYLCFQEHIIHNYKRESDPIADMLFIIGGVIMILGLIGCGLSMRDEIPFFEVGIYQVCGGFVSGFLFFGFAKILYYLKKIESKLDNE